MCATTTSIARDRASKSVGRQPRHNLRFSHVASQALREWVGLHEHHPYPSEDEKAVLGAATGLTLRQINNWFANARRRKKDHHASTQASPGLTVSNMFPDSPSGSCLGDASRESSGNRIYQCTFCTDTFVFKYDWTRHETSLHLPLKRYICCPFSPTTTDPATRTEICSYCGASDPTTAHVELHHHTSCQDRAPEARIFSRKDHLRQHLRLVHECELLPHMDGWLLEAVYVNSRCGFCNERFTIWSERNDHIASHFKEGCRMESWKGCRGLDALVSAQATAAMPPFLIGLERFSPRPYSASATKRASIASKLMIESATRSSPWESLAIELHKLVQQFTVMRVMVSDDDLQKHARLVVHGTYETQTKTAADNPEWLDLFKRAHSLGVIPDSVDGRTPTIPDDLEVYQDLGLRMPAVLRAQRSSALVTMFWSDGPLLKTYHRFSSLDVPLSQAWCFETISAPWPDAGVPGEMLITRDRMFGRFLDAGPKAALMPPSLGFIEEITEEDDELSTPESSNGSDDLARYMAGDVIWMD